MRRRELISPKLSMVFETVVAPVLGSYIFFLKTEDDPAALKNVQWVYLAIAIFVFIPAAVFYL